MKRLALAVLFVLSLLAIAFVVMPSPHAHAQSCSGVTVTHDNGSSQCYENATELLDVSSVASIADAANSGLFVDAVETSPTPGDVVIDPGQTDTFEWAVFIDITIAYCVGPNICP